MPSAPPLDSRIEIVTPENIAFEYRLAGPFRRLPAYLIDLGIRALILFFASIALLIGLGWIGAAGIAMGIILVLWFVLAWFYGGLFEALWNGQTPGKRLMRLRVLTVDGQPITATQAVLRNILRSVDAFPLVPLPGTEALVPMIPLHLFGLAAAAMNDRFQRLGDLACGTIVVEEERQQVHGVEALRDPTVAALAAELPPGFIASRGLAQALSVYVSRRQYFTPLRRMEVARTLADPLRDRLGLPPGTAADQLLCALYYRTFIGRGEASAAREVTNPATVVPPLETAAPDVVEQVGAG